MTRAEIELEIRFAFQSIVSEGKAIMYVPREGEFRSLDSHGLKQLDNQFYVQEYPGFPAVKIPAEKIIEIGLDSFVWGRIIGKIIHNYE